jgi:hypothetical protein
VEDNLVVPSPTLTFYSAASTLRSASEFCSIRDTAITPETSRTKFKLRRREQRAEFSSLTTGTVHMAFWDWRNRFLQRVSKVSPHRFTKSLNS